MFFCFVTVIFVVPSFKLLCGKIAHYYLCGCSVFFMAVANIYFVWWFFGVRLVRCYSCDALFIFRGSCYFFCFVAVIFCRVEFQTSVR